MVAIGMGLGWLAYTAGLYGYSLIRGYCNTFAGLVNPVNPAAWSTTVYTGTAVIPSGCGPAPAASSSSGGAIANQAANEANSSASNVTGGAVGSGGTSQPGSTSGSMGGIGGTGIR